MIKSLLVMPCAVGLLAAFFSAPEIAAPCAQPAEDRSIAVAFFDVPGLPARIDQPKLHQTERGFVLKCAIANRQGEQLLGLRLILLVVDPAGKLRRRITWTEGFDLEGYSIGTFPLHPNMVGNVRDDDQLVLGIDEVIGRETIWRAPKAEEALSAYSRGQHSWLPTVLTFANKFDSPPRGAAPFIRIY